MSNIIFSKFQPAPGYDNEKHIFMGPNGLVIEYYFNQDGYFEIIIVKQTGNIYIMDSNANGIIKRTSFTWNDLYAYLQSDFRLKFALEYVGSHYYNYGSKRVMSRSSIRDEIASRDDDDRNTGRTSRGSRANRSSSSRRNGSRGSRSSRSSRSSSRRGNSMGNSMNRRSSRGNRMNNDDNV